MPIDTVQYQQGLATVRSRSAAVLLGMWDDLGDYRDDAAALFVAEALPIVEAAQQIAVSLTMAYMADQLGRPADIDGDALVGAAVRNGADPAAVYLRPFEAVWSALGRGAEPPAAIKAGRARLEATADMDVALSTRAAARDAMAADPRVTGWRREPDGGACDFCLLASTQRYSSEDLMPLHNRCGCTVSPIIGPSKRVVDRQLLDQLKDRGVKIYDNGEVRSYGGLTPPVVHEHGELGPVLASSGDDFTGPADI